MLPTYVLLDLETTGATATFDRITEIGLIRFQKGVEVGRWNTLINPETTIPYHIQRLTGITQEMVRDAPTFADINYILQEWLDDAVLCAHNVRFDYGFLKNEFSRLGINFQKKVLCTVKLSRKLYSHCSGHSLDAIIQRFNIICEKRHRAMDDVLVMMSFITQAIKDFGLSAVQEAAKAFLKQQSIPIHLDPLHIQNIPDTCGAYLFYGESALLYIGKSIKLRSRIMSHFQSDHASSKEMRIAQEVRHIEYRVTAGEFGALILESRLIKKLMPIYNHKLRKNQKSCGWFIANNSQQKPLVRLIYQKDINWSSFGYVYGIFNTQSKAINFLRTLAEEHGLCHKALGLEKGSGACFSHQLKKCRGVCVDKESTEQHYLRFVTAISSQRITKWPFDGKIGIREYNAKEEKIEIHVFDDWCHLGSATDYKEAAQISSEKHFDADIYRYLVNVLKKHETEIMKIS